MTGSEKQPPIHPWRLREATRHFRQGALIAYPTEAVYGIGCDPLNWPAVQRLLKLKQRPVEKGLILIAADFDQLRPFVQELPQQRMKAIFATWPGPATWLLPAAPGLPYWLRGHHPTLAVRVTAHPLAAALCRACNSPLVSTSANLSQRPPARSALQVRTCLENQIPLILSGPLGGRQKPTPIRNGGDGRIVRA